MNNQFTPHAISALKFAQKEALDSGRSHIGPEHLLLGILHEREGMAAQVLSELGVDFETARSRIGRVTGTREGEPDNPYYTPSAKRVMQFSVEEANQLGHDYIGTEHILLALTRESGNTAARVLSSLGADLDLVRETVFEMLEAAGRGGGNLNQSCTRLDTELYAATRTTDIHILNLCAFGEVLHDGGAVEEGGY